MMKLVISFDEFCKDQESAEVFDFEKATDDLYKFLNYLYPIPNIKKAYWDFDNTEIHIPVATV